MARKLTKPTTSALQRRSEAKSKGSKAGFVLKVYNHCVQIIIRKDIDKQKPYHKYFIHLNAFCV